MFEVVDENQRIGLIKGVKKTNRKRYATMRDSTVEDNVGLAYTTNTLTELVESGAMQLIHRQVPKELEEFLSSYEACRTNGGKAVMFRQSKAAGRFGLSEFSKLKNIEISFASGRLNHCLYHFRLPYSGWSHIKVILCGESYTALAEGLQDALQRLDGVPKEHRKYNLSAASKNLSNSEQEDLTERYHTSCEHYGMTPTRNNRGICHENGAVESPLGHIKARSARPCCREIVMTSIPLTTIAWRCPWPDGQFRDSKYMQTKS